MLNVDLVTLFEPQEMDEFQTIKQECEKLMEESKKRLAQQKWLLRMAETDQPIPLDIEQLEVLPEDEAEIEAEVEAMIKSFNLKGSSDKLAHELAACTAGGEAAADLELDVPIKVADLIDFSFLTAADLEYYNQMKSCNPDEIVRVESDEVRENADEMEMLPVAEEEMNPMTADVQQVPLMEL